MKNSKIGGGGETGTSSAEIIQRPVSTLYFSFISIRVAPQASRHVVTWRLTRLHRDQRMLLIHPRLILLAIDSFVTRFALAPPPPSPPLHP